MKVQYSEAKWRDNKLYIRNKKTEVSIVPDQEHPDLWRVSWSDGKISPDFYNLTRAKDNAVRWYQLKKNKRQDPDLGDAHGDV